MRAGLHRRTFVLGAAGLVASRVMADPLRQFSPDLWPPMAQREAYIQWMTANRGEDPEQLSRRYERFQQIDGIHDLWTANERRAFLMTPREEFVLPEDRDQAYERHYLDIGFGVSITPPGVVGRMTSALALRWGDNVLEVGTGSGYQSALLSYLTPRLHSIEIIEDLATRTREVYDSLIARGYREYANISTRAGDGYFGWPDAAPFDKVIVTCGIDHVPPPLLLQLRLAGTMVIPVGPPGAQHILKIVKTADASGSATVTRSDLFGGVTIPFVPLSGGHQPDAEN
jgi:protein-L-isoaspartate(D-aspartate) O-methyltransferase